jgi:uncharacterized cupin superfamily protein
MSDVNVFEPEWDAEGPDPFRGRIMRVGHHAGAGELGATLYELDPGGATSPYHLHHGNEELLVVLDGRPSLRTPAGTRELAPGAVVSFPRGKDGAHRIFNASDARARVLIVSTMNYPEVAEHVDTGTVLAITEPQQALAFPAGTDKPVMEAVIAAMRAAAQPDGEPGEAPGGGPGLD